ncbi:MAG: DUF4097 family beta strand repeat-containing protein, partial [Thermocrispum sp.]
SGTAAAVNVTTSAGDVALGRVDGPLRVRTGGGDVSVEAVTATASVVTGIGSVRVAAVDGELSARTGSGAVTVTDAAAGTVTVKSGSGDVQVGLRSGVLAEVHLASVAGSASSELEVSQEPPDGAEAALVVSARSGSGTVTVSGSGD